MASRLVHSMRSAILPCAYRLARDTVHRPRSPRGWKKAASMARLRSSADWACGTLHAGAPALSASEIITGSLSLSLMIGMTPLHSAARTMFSTVSGLIDITSVSRMTKSKPAWPMISTMTGVMVEQVMPRTTLPAWKRSRKAR